MYHSRNVGMVIGTAQLLLPMSSSTTSPAAQRHCAYPFKGLCPFLSSSSSFNRRLYQSYKSRGGAPPALSWGCSDETW